MRRWVWLLSVPISLGLHALALAAVVWVLAEVRSPGVLYVDLNSSAPARAPAAPAPAAPAPALPRPPKPKPPVEHDVPRPMPSPVKRETSTLPQPPSIASRPQAPTVAEPPRVQPSAPPAQRDESVSVVTLAPSFAHESAKPAVGLPTGLPAREGDDAGASRGSGNGGGIEGGAPRAVALGTGGATGGEGDYGPYRAALRRRIQEVLRYPSAARRRGLSGTVELEIVVQPSGAIADVAVVDSSSHRILDEAALEAVLNLPRLPFPDGLQPRSLTVRLPVVFELR
jgi:protein TonB